MIRRRAGRQWYSGIIGIVMVLHGGGVLFDWYLTRRVLELLYPGREAPGFETRDMTWAAAFLIVGALLVVLAAGRLMVRRPVIRATRAGILLSIGRPLSRPIPVPWEQVQEIWAGTDDDGFGASPVLLLRIKDLDLSGSGLWGARRNGEVLSISASGWDCRPEEAADRVREADRAFALDPETGLDSGLIESGSEAVGPPGSSREEQGEMPGDEISAGMSEKEPTPEGDPASRGERVPE